MSLESLQAALARVYTVAPDRATLREGAACAAETLAVPLETAAALGRIDADHIERFSQALIHKRRGDVWKLLPLTARALGVAGVRVFAGFAQQESRALQASIRDAALGLVAFLRAAAARACAGPDQVGAAGADAHALPLWIVDLARLEAARLELVSGRRRWVWRAYRHHPAELVAYVVAGAMAQTHSPRAGWTLQFAWRAGGRLHTWTFARRRPRMPM